MLDEIMNRRELINRSELGRLTEFYNNVANETMSVGNGWEKVCRITMHKKLLWEVSVTQRLF